jgi:eukaryotic-like serine/threonine-protein kinase
MICPVESGRSASRLQFGSVTLIPEERILLKEGRPVPLTPKAFDLLAILAANPGRLLTKEHLMERLWPDTVVEESNLTYHVFAIRKALGDTAENGQYIETVPRRGYRFMATVTVAEGGAEAEPGSGQLLAPEARPLRSAFMRRWLRVALWVGVGVFGAGGVWILTDRRAVPTPSLIRAQIAQGVHLSEASPFALSPDSQHLVFAGTGPDGVNRLWVRRMDTEIPRPLPGTETALGGLTPPMFWSPDSQSIAFDSPGKLKRVDISGGAPRAVCDLPNLAIGGSWNADDVIIVGQPAGGLIRCSAVDGSVSELTRIDPTRAESAHVFPSFLPDGRHFVYLGVSRQTPERSGVYLGSLDDPPGARRADRLIATGFGPAYVRTEGASSGHVLYLRDQTLFAQTFDERRLALVGEPVSLASPVGSFLDGGFFSVSPKDVIAFRAPDEGFQLTWFDRRGDKLGVVGEVGRYSTIAMSPDGSRVATAKEVFTPNIDQDIWMFDVARTAMTRVTFQPVLEGYPVWSADGKRVFFTTGGGIGGLFEQPVDGASGARVVLKEKEYLRPSSASADGRYVLYAIATLGPSRMDTWVLPLDDPGKRFPLVQRNFDQWQAQFSPDGRWVAYVSSESGRHEVLVRRFVTPSERTTSEPETVVVSTAGGVAPRWRSDGKELYFLAADGSVMAADVTVGAGFSFATPRALFQVPKWHGDWAVASGGSRFLIAIPPGPDTSAPFTILWNRLAGLATPAP